MLAVIQTNYDGIDGLEYQQVAKPELTDDGVLVQMSTVPVVPTDWKQEANAHATHATKNKAGNLPRTIGYGGVGRVVAVGKNRDQALLNQRVYLMNPAGTYSEYVLSTDKARIFPLPEAVDDASAAALTFGPGTALALKQAIDESRATSIVLTGGNSVVGLYLLQLLTKESRPLYPIVREDSQPYFKQQQPSRACYTTGSLPQLDDCLIVDISGSTGLLAAIKAKAKQTQVVSIALQEYPDANFKFTHEAYDPKNYERFIQQLASGDLHAPIDRSFPVAQTKEAQHYAKESHSRGRVLVTFDKH